MIPDGWVGVSLKTQSMIQTTGVQATQKSKTHLKPDCETHTGEPVIYTVKHYVLMEPSYSYVAPLPGVTSVRQSHQMSDAVQLCNMYASVRQVQALIVVTYSRASCR